MSTVLNSIYSIPRRNKAFEGDSPRSVRLLATQNRNIHSQVVRYLH